MIYSFDYIGTNCCVQIWQRSFKHLQGSSWWAVPAISGGSELWVGCSMPSYNKVYSLDNCWMLHNFITSNIRRILLTCWRMQLTSCSTILWELWINWMTYHLIKNQEMVPSKIFLPVLRRGDENELAGKRSFSLPGKFMMINIRYFIDHKAKFLSC